MIVDLAEATPDTCGAKAGWLGRLIRAGAPVPPGFVIPSGTPAAALPGMLAERLAALGDPPVAVRSSAGAEDTPTASAAGQHDSFLGVRGAAAVAEKVAECRVSLWSPRAVAYRATRGLPDDPAMAVIVQRHIDADVAGVLFTGDPCTVEASWGLGESVVQGRVTPDSWTVPPSGGVRYAAGDKRVRVDRGSAGTVARAVPEADRLRPCLDDGEVARVVAAGREVARVLGGPLDIEWAMAGGEIWVLQARPVTAALPGASPTAVSPTAVSPTAGPPTAGPPTAGPPTAGPPTAGPPTAGPSDYGPGSGGSSGLGTGVGGPAWLTGVPGSAGTAVGPARVVAGPGDFARVAPGDILVCRFTDPAWTPLFAVVAGVVTEIGGVLSHAAIVAREHRVPAVLGVPGVMTAVRDGQTVVVDGDVGTVRPAPGP